MSGKNFDYETSRNLIVKRLKRESSFHEQAQFEKMGEVYDDFDEKFPTGHPELRIAWTFWDAWIDERNHGFPENYQGIPKDAWPRIAGHIIEALEKKVPISDPVVLANFDFTEKPTFWDKVKDFFSLRNFFKTSP